MLTDELEILKAQLEIAPNSLKIFKTFKDNEIITQTLIKNKFNFRTSEVSRQFKKLIKLDLIYITNPNIKKGKQYKLTDQGKQIIKYL